MINDLEKFNKDLNIYFDTKTFFNYQNNKINIIESHKYFEKKFFSNINFKTSKKKITLNLFNFNKYNQSQKKYLKPLNDIYNEIQKTKLKKYFKYFLVHGSIADNNFIKGWSDIDTFVVIKNEIFTDKQKILRLKRFIKSIYKFFFRLCPLQHHGLILYSEYDLEFYSKNYMPIEAIKYNLNLLDRKKILKVKLINNKNTKTLRDLKDRLKLLKEAKKFGSYKHHPLKKKYLKFPLKNNVKQMYQLFCHIGFMNTLPAYFLTCINKSVNKKDSFKLFKLYFRNKRILNLVKKNENVRKFWEVYNKDIKSHFYIEPWITKMLGNNYLTDTIFTLEKVIQKIEKKNEKIRL